MDIIYECKECHATDRLSDLEDRCSESGLYKCNNCLEYTSSKTTRESIDPSSKLYEVEQGIESVIVWISHFELEKYHNDEPFEGMCEATGEKLRFNQPWNCTVEESN